MADYPKVLSKMDPLIVRIDELTLLVGSTSYKAKIKTGIKYSGFYIYVNGIGEPIYTEYVNVSRESLDTDSNNVEDGDGKSDAYEKIKGLAETWIDKLQKSFDEADNQKNIVDLLEEIKCQLHFDITGSSALYIPDKMEGRVEIDGDIKSSTIKAQSDVIHKDIDRIAKNTMSSTTDEEGNTSTLFDKLESIDTLFNTICQGDSGILYKLCKYTGEVSDNTKDINTTLDTKLDTVNTTVTNLSNKIYNNKTNENTVVNKLNDIAANTNTVANKLDNMATTISNSISGDGKEKDNSLAARLTASMSTINTTLGGIATNVGFIKTDTGKIANIVQNEGSYYYINTLDKNSDTMVNTVDIIEDSLCWGDNRENSIKEKMDIMCNRLTNIEGSVRYNDGTTLLGEVDYITKAFLYDGNESCHIRAEITNFPAQS